MERYLIRILTNNSGLKKSEINASNKSIHLGLYGIATCFFEPKHQLAMYLLVRIYKYKLLETTIKITDI
jgi:hypothetical protein